MRTTLTIEPAIAAQIRQRMERRGQSLKSVVNEILREGLRAGEDKPRRGMPRFKVKPHAFGFRAGIDLDRISQFADELEDEERLMKLTAGVKS